LESSSSFLRKFSSHGNISTKATAHNPRSSRHLDIRVDKQGKALCPFHDDKTPSLQFSKEKNICTCFSSKCDAGTMDIIGLTEKKLKLNTHEAIMKLKEWANHQPTNGKSKSAKFISSPNPSKKKPYPELPYSPKYSATLKMA
jgi:DNA primase